MSQPRYRIPKKLTGDRPGGRKPHRERNNNDDHTGDDRERDEADLDGVLFSVLEKGFAGVFELVEFQLEGLCFWHCKWE